MIQQLHEKISVVSLFDALAGKIIPKRFKWKSREYTIKEIGYYHARREGRVVEHVFDVTDETTSYRLVCSGDTLMWTLEEMSDGNPN